MNCTEAFIEYLFQKADAINSPIYRKAEECRTDYLAVAEAGARKTRKQWLGLLEHLPAGNAELFGYHKRTDGKTAALINGFNAHCLELDDGQRFAMIHLGASIISAIFAAEAEYNTLPEEDFLRGIVMGYEAACRTAIAMQPSHKNRGYHAAGTCGTIGAAVGVAFALRMGKKQMKRVLTCAAGSAAGMLEMQAQDSELKPYNVGRAAMDGLCAALMGFTDYETPEDILGGERGFFRTFSDSFDVTRLTEETTFFEIERIYVKPYASCRHSHSAVEAAVKLHDGLKCEDIERVTVETYKLAVKGHDHSDICGIASAKLSTAYAVAVALLYGRADLTVFEPLSDTAISLAKRVTVFEDKELTKQSPQKRIAVVTIYLRNGSHRTCRVDYAKGDPENPMTEEELAEKSRMLNAYAPIQ